MKWLVVGVAACLAACAQPAVEGAQAPEELQASAIAPRADGAFLAREINLVAPATLEGCGAGRVLNPDDPVDGVLEYRCAHGVRVSLWTRTIGWPSAEEGFLNAIELLPKGEWAIAPIRDHGADKVRDARMGADRRTWRVSATAPVYAIYGAEWNGATLGADAEAVRALDLLAGSVTKQP